MYIYSRAKDNRVVCTTYDIICVFDLKEKIAMFALFFCRKICADERRLRQGTPAKFSAHSHGFIYTNICTWQAGNFISTEVSMCRYARCRKNSHK